MILTYFRYISSYLSSYLASSEDTKSIDWGVYIVIDSIGSTYTRNISICNTYAIGT